ncbi:YgjV family protein [Pilimelia terevasa]|uniref:YgjV family protein n=1 Tax=Pilimelia terevasa TaxID=53372 RepID=UPI0016690B38|nr:YgjV family protein [Pilimelia terevasa]
MNWLEMLGWTGSAVLVWSLLQTRILRLRGWNLLGSVLLVAYNAAVGVWPMVGLNVVLTVINVAHLGRLLRTRRDTSAYAVVELPVADPFLRHLLTVHGADVARFNPGFRWPYDAADRTAFLVLRADEVVGIVLVRALPDRVAQVELDYVTPRYRDFTPGYFVFRRSGALTDRGFRRVVTPPGMVAPYYAGLGFTRQDGAYALDLPGAG